MAFFSMLIIGGFPVWIAVDTSAAKEEYWKESSDGCLSGDGENLHSDNASSYHTKEQ